MKKRATSEAPVTVTTATTIALIEQLLPNLSPDASQDGAHPLDEDPAALLLLNAWAKVLKAQVTKLSLLTITAPFTATAVATCLKPVNDQILPSLVTATLLVETEAFTPSFYNESKSLSRSILRELLALIRLVEARSKDGQPSKELSESKKKEVTEATGRSWDTCDAIIAFSDEGLPGFVVRKSKQWLDLMKDAVKELSDWDPEEEVDDLFGDAESTSDGDNASTEKDEGDSADRATISAGVKDQALKVLNRIPQSVHVVIKQRLEKLKTQPTKELSTNTRNSLEAIIKRTRDVSELIDESAEGMYMGDLELCLKKAGEARAETIEIVQSVLQPFSELAISNTAVESQEDKYIKRALEWVQQVDAGSAKAKS